MKLELQISVTLPDVNAPAVFARKILRVLRSPAAWLMTRNVMSSTSRWYTRGLNVVPENARESRGAFLALRIVRASHTMPTQTVSQCNGI